MVLSTQHLPNVSHEIIEKDIINKVIVPVIPKELLDKNTRYLINPTGRFVVGGPQGDTGLTRRKIEEAGISYNFFYLTGISGAGRGEIGAKATAEVFNQCHPQIIDASMMTIYKTSELYKEIQKGNWKEESEIEKLAELKTLIENLTVEARFATDGASNLIQVRGNLPTDQKKLVKYLERLIATADEAALREYRVNLKHL